MRTAVNFCVHGMCACLMNMASAWTSDEQQATVAALCA